MNSGFLTCFELEPEFLFLLKLPFFASKSNYNNPVKRSYLIAQFYR